MLLLPYVHGQLTIHVQHSQNALTIQQPLMLHATFKEQDAIIQTQQTQPLLVLITQQQPQLQLQLQQ